MMNNNITGSLSAAAPLYLNLSSFVGDSIVDGPGLRCTIFCQGCPHHCPGCHNPESHTFEGGTPYTAIQIVTLVEKFPLCREVTFSGGEPFCQADGFLELAILLKAKGYKLAAYTGYTFEQLLAGTKAQQNLLSALDILIDGPFLLDKRDLSLRFRGSANQRILNIPQSLEQKQAVWETAPRWIGG